MMYKLVVFFAFVAAAAAKPDAVITSPIIPFITPLGPVRTTSTNQFSSILHPSPVVYSASLATPHIVKKRSAPISYLATSPALTTTYTAPLVHSAPLVSTTSYLSAPVAYTSAHLIKKRGAILPTTYIAPATYAAAPIVTSTYTAAATPLIASSPLISHPVTYTSHFIKKRSAPLLTTYITPASVSHQSRIDVHGTTPLVTSYTSPVAYTSPLAISHVI